MGFFKFPTTPHVLDLTNGKALSESDRLLSADEAKEFFDAWAASGPCGSGFRLERPRKATRKAFLQTFFGRHKDGGLAFRTPYIQPLAGGSSV